MLHDVLEHVERLRELEARAREDPGREMDHDHDESHAFREYDRAWRGLVPLLASPPQPDSWIAFAGWCGENDTSFGDVKLPGTHRTEVRWVPGERDLRDLIPRSIERLLEERLCRPELDPVWTDERLHELLRNPGWREGPAKGSLARVAALLHPVAPALSGELRAALSGSDHFGRPIGEKVDRWVEEMDWFTFRELRVEAQRGAVVMTVDFEEDLPPGEGVRLSLVVRETRAPLGEFRVNVCRFEPGGPLASESSARAERSLGRVRLRVPTGRFHSWKHAGRADSRELSPGEVLALDVGRAGPGYLAGEATFPDIEAAEGSAHGARLADADSRCSSCGDETPVLVNDGCPACRVDEVPAARPVPSEFASRLEESRRRWAETACPDCGGQSFSSRFSSGWADIPDDYVCTACGVGWIIRDGEVEGPDDSGRAAGEPSPSEAWARVAGSLERGLRQSQPKLADIEELGELAASLDPDELSPSWREWLLRLADVLERYFEAYLVFDDFDRKWVDTGGDAAEKAARELRGKLE